MGTKMKGFFQEFKYNLSQIFVVKEPEIEIGLPTDVKHVAHIGWDGGAGTSGTAPSWMNEFKTGPDFSTSSIGNSGCALSPWSSQCSGETMHQKSTSESLTDAAPAEASNIKKKQRRKKCKPSSSPKSSSSSSSTSRVPKSKSRFVEGQGKPTNIEVS